MPMHATLLSYRTGLTSEESHPPDSQMPHWRWFPVDMDWRWFSRDIDWGCLSVDIDWKNFFFALVTMMTLYHVFFIRPMTAQLAQMTSPNHHNDIEQLKGDPTAMMEKLTELIALLEVQELRLQEATDRISKLEEDIIALNANKADRAAVEELTESLEELESEKVGKTELEILSENVTSLEEETLLQEEVITTLKANFDGLKTDMKRLTEATNKQKGDLENMKNTLEENQSSVQQQMSDVLSRLSRMSSDIHQNSDTVENVRASFKRFTKDITDKIKNLDDQTIVDILRNSIHSFW